MWPNSQFPADLVTFKKSSMENFTFCAVLMNEDSLKTHKNTVFDIINK